MLSAEEKLKIFAFPMIVRKQIYCYDPFSDPHVNNYICCLPEIPINAVARYVETLRAYKEALKANGGCRLKTEEENRFWDTFFSDREVISVMVRHNLE